MSDIFLTKDEVAELTGRKFKSLQIAQLKKMAIPFWLDAMNVPIVPRSAIDGRNEVIKPERVKVVPRLFQEMQDRKDQALTGRATKTTE